MTDCKHHWVERLRDDGVMICKHCGVFKQEAFMAKRKTIQNEIERCRTEPDLWDETLRVIQREVIDHIVEQRYL